MFFSTIPPVEPVSLVKAICMDAVSNHTQKRTRFVKRLSPMTLIGRASLEGLEKTACEVLEPHFHRSPIDKRKVRPATRLPVARRSCPCSLTSFGIKFAIRPTLRNHNSLTRDAIIQAVASTVGPGHEVDLKNYDLLIVVEVYQVYLPIQSSRLRCVLTAPRIFVESASWTTTSSD